MRRSTARPTAPAPFRRCRPAVLSGSTPPAASSPPTLLCGHERRRRAHARRVCCTGFPRRASSSTEGRPTDALATAVVELVRHLARAARVCLGRSTRGPAHRVGPSAPELTTSASQPEAQRTLIAIVACRGGGGRRAAYHAFQVPERSGRLRVVRPAFVRHAHREGSSQVWTVDARPTCTGCSTGRRRQSPIVPTWPCRPATPLTNRPIIGSVSGSEGSRG